MINLYPDQEELVQQVRVAMRQHKRVLMQAATGSGKTVIGAAMIAGTRAKGTRSIFMVPRRELLRQSALTFSDYDIPFGYVAAGYEMNPYAKTQIATTGTLINRLEKVVVPNVLFVDECHYGGAATERIIEYFAAKGTWIVGLSATPLKPNGKGMGTTYTHMVQGKSIGWLIANNRLSDYRLFAPSQPNLSGIKIVAGDYAKNDLASRMEEDRILIGNAVGHYREHAMGRLNISYCTSRKHSEIVAESFRNAGIPAAAVDGETPENELKAKIRAFARRELLVLANCDLFTFGFDLAAASGMDVCVEALSDLRPTRSLPLQLQKWGRVLRYKKESALIFDHGGNVQVHALPDAERVWSLRSTHEDKEAGRVAPVRQCTQCFFVHSPAPKCPNCGLVYPVQSRMVEEVDGDLVEVARLRDTMSGIDYERMRARIDDLTQRAMRKGMSEFKAAQWAAKKVTQELQG